jgi:hypothetical protein
VGREGDDGRVGEVGARDVVKSDRPGGHCPVLPYGGVCSSVR